MFREILQKEHDKRVSDYKLNYYDKIYLRNSIIFYSLFVIFLSLAMAIFQYSYIASTVSIILFIIIIFRLPVKYVNFDNSSSVNSNSNYTHSFIYYGKMEFYLSLNKHDYKKYKFSEVKQYSIYDKSEKFIDSFTLYGYETGDTKLLKNKCDLILRNHILCKGKSPGDFLDRNFIISMFISNKEVNGNKKHVSLLYIPFSYLHSYEEIKAHQLQSVSYYLNDFEIMEFTSNKIELVKNFYIIPEIEIRITPILDNNSLQHFCFSFRNEARIITYDGNHFDKELMNGFDIRRNIGLMYPLDFKKVLNFARGK